MLSSCADPPCVPVGVAAGTESLAGGGIWRAVQDRTAAAIHGARICSGTLLRRSEPVKPRVAPSPLRYRPAQMPPSVESASRINLRWIVRLRWGAVAGQVITILFASRILRQALPVGQLLAVCGALALINLATHVWLLRGGNPTARAAGLNLLGDVLALTALL